LSHWKNEDGELSNEIKEAQFLAKFNRFNLIKHSCLTTSKLRLMNRLMLMRRWGSFDRKKHRKMTLF